MLRRKARKMSRVSAATAHDHVEEAKLRLHVRTRVQAALAAREKGLPLA
jgi:DNA-binding NarL/FixJ family response regulator